MICKKCGEYIEDGQCFCSNCGTDVQSFDMKAEQPNLTTKTNKQPNSNKKKTIYILVVVVAVVLALVLSIVIVHNLRQTSNLKKALNSKNAYQVNMAYEEAKSKNQKLDKFDKLIGQTIQQITEDVNKHDFENEALRSGNDALWQYLHNEWGTLVVDDENTDSYIMHRSISFDNQADWENLQKLLESKSSFCKGIFCYKGEKNYSDAVSYFTEMDPIDSKYDVAVGYTEECVELYMQTALNEIDQRVIDGDLDIGISMLQELENDLSVMGEVSEGVQKKIESTLKMSADSYMKKAEEYLKAGDINAAIGHVEAAIAINPDGGYEAKLEEYKQYEPLPLYKEDNVLKTTQEEGFWGVAYFNQTVKANDNTEYSHCITWYNNNSDVKSKLQMEYVLNGKYNQLSGTLLLPQSERNTTQVGYFEVCGDGKVLYTSPKMTGGVLPTEITCDVTNVQKLTINFYGQGTGGFLGSGSNFAVSNLVVKKTMQ